MVDEVPVGDNIPGNTLMRALCLPWGRPHIPEKEFGTMGDIPLEPLTQTRSVRWREQWWVVTRSGDGEDRSPPSPACIFSTPSGNKQL